MSEAERIAKGLTRQLQAMILGKPPTRKTLPVNVERSTWRYLENRGLALRREVLSPLGLEVRAILERTDRDT